MDNTVNSEGYLIQNGERLPADTPVVTAQDAAFIQGHGIFETIAAYRGRPFALAAHWKRLVESARVLGLEAPPLLEVEQHFEELLQANQLTDHEQSRLRLTIAGGVGSTNVILEATPCPVHPSTASVITGPFYRNERGLLSGIKTISYGENAVAMREAAETGATEAIWKNTREELCEGTWSNIFVRIDGVWITPPLSSGCLPGVTRATVLALAKREGVPMEEDVFPMSQLAKVEAGFLTSSIRELQPISRLDSRALHSRECDEISLLQKAYAEEVAAHE